MKYRKKPVVIEAEQFFPDVYPWPEGVARKPDLLVTGFAINTLEGQMRVSPGDWIITGVKGEKYPCKDEIFRLTYEKVEEQE